MRELRAEKGLTQADLGKKLSVANNTISSWERGNSEPTLDQLRKMVGIFGVTAGVLIGTE